ncbi:helix-turn-helix domain-containing protein [Brevibacillus fluminis]|uniref:helix-turn-helix domain-containing protein n=1 Tax=Brevibacillus fluminis TaxID=511487 RepID=UPI003F8C375A
MTTLSKFYTPRQVASLLGLSQLTIYKWIDEGKLKAYKVNQRWMIEQKDVENLVYGKGGSQK